MAKKEDCILSSEHKDVERLFEALGIPFDDAYSYVLTITPNEAVKVEVGFYVTESKLEKTFEVLKKYHLIENV